MQTITLDFGVLWNASAVFHQKFRLGEVGRVTTLDAILGEFSAIKSFDPNLMRQKTSSCNPIIRDSQVLKLVC